MRIQAHSIIQLLLSLSCFIISEAKAVNPDTTGTGNLAVSILPILMYDSDIGVGFGGKGVIRDSARYFDLTLFGSSKGQQWYAFAYSTPDPDYRQGKAKILSFDSKLEYEKILKRGYFGIGNDTKDNDFDFPKETTTMQISGGYSFSKSLSVSLASRYLHYAVYDYDQEESLLHPLVPGTGENQLFAASISLRYDTRDSQINPTRGIRIDISGEKGLKVLESDWDFAKIRGEFSAYHPVLGASDIIAVRLWIQKIDRVAPFQELSAIGDGWTARGYKAGRFLDRGMTLTSIEYRYPIYKKLGGVVFIDAGRVWRDFSELSLTDWHSDFGGGLRYYLANFLVRLDIGHSTEGTRIFFNFGQVF